jgi:hypothetical protein
MPSCVSSYTLEALDADTNAPIPGCKEVIKPPTLFSRLNSAPLAGCAPASLLPAGRGSRRVRVRVAAVNGKLAGGANVSAVARVDRVTDGAAKSFSLCKEGATPYEPPRLFWIKRNPKVRWSG